MMHVFEFCLYLIHHVESMSRLEGASCAEHGVWDESAGLNPTPLIRRRPRGAVVAGQPGRAGGGAGGKRGGLEAGGGAPPRVVQRGRARRPARAAAARAAGAGEVRRAGTGHTEDSSGNGSSEILLPAPIHHNR